MKKISISDITLRDCAKNSETSLSFKEKLEIAKQLDKLKTDVIELPEIKVAKTDTLLNKTIASLIKYSCISATVGLSPEAVPNVWDSIKNAKKPRLHVMVPVSAMQMEYICKRKGPQVLELIKELVSECKKYCSDVEFSAVDAARAEKSFLYEAINTAIASGATLITICDSEGSMMPEEFGAFIAETMSNTDKVDLAIEVSDKLNMAASCAAAALRTGAVNVKTTIHSAGYATMEQMVGIIDTREDYIDGFCEVKKTELKRAVKQMLWIIESKKDGRSMFDSMANEEERNINLTSKDGITEVINCVRQLGYDLSEEDNAKVYDAFKVLAEKKNVGEKEMEAIIASVALQVPETYQLETYVINSGNVISATANIALKKDGKTVKGISAGDGPIDAAFLAIEQIIGCRYELDDFQIQSVTEGREAMGAALVKLRSGGKLYSGKGISTDIIGASIAAYINAVNKIVYEEA